ncbi:MAG: GFA family protein, partial [Pseudomonadota bacterium]
MIEGGCHCGAIRYRISADRVTGGQCHCRACQRYSGGGPNLFALIEPDAFTYTKGTPKRFAHPDLPDAVTRSFC